MAAIAVAAGPRAEAGIVQISDFTLTGGTSSITAFGGLWLWDQANRELGVGSNAASDYLFGTIFPGSAPNIQGVTTVSLTAAWTPLDPPNTPDGQFILALYNQGDLKASAVYNYGNFASGQTVVKSLTWTTDPSLSTVVDQWQIIGNGNSDQTLGDLVLTNMSVSTSAAVPEIDPGSASAALAVLFGSLGLVERNRRRLPIARRGATAAA
jgi:hypothetical protein